MPAIGVVFEDPELERSVRSGLDEVETGLRAAVRSDDEIRRRCPRATWSTPAASGSGRCSRVLAAPLRRPGRAGDHARPRVVVELTHLATLYHDDVMDEALVRRGAASANARWGNTVAILTGDFLFARASNLLADLGPEAVRMQARTFERLVTGQIRETVGPGPDADPIDALPAACSPTRPAR